MKIGKIIILICLFAFVSCANDKRKTCDKFFEYYNNYQKDSLGILLSDNFQGISVLNLDTTNKKKFLMYMEEAKKSNAKFNVLGIENEKYLVEETSDYNKYLDVKSPVWAIRFVCKANKIESILIDTTANYFLFEDELKIKEKKYFQWLGEKYASDEDMMNALRSDPDLYIKEMKEYAKFNHSGTKKMP